MTAPSDPAAESPAPRRRLARSRRALVVGALVVALVLTAFVSFRWGSAGYTPVISDGERVFLTGFQTVWAFDAKRK